MAHEIAASSERLVAFVFGAGVQTSDCGSIFVNELENVHRRVWRVEGGRLERDDDVEWWWEKEEWRGVEAEQAGLVSLVGRESQHTGSKHSGRYKLTFSGT